jgi:hypothetical protein
MTDRESCLKSRVVRLLKFGMCKQSFAHAYHIAVSALDSSPRRRIGEQQPRSRTPVGNVAPSINNGAGCNEKWIAAGSREKFFLTAPFHRTCCSSGAKTGSAKYVTAVSTVFSLFRYGPITSSAERVFAPQEQNVYSSSLPKQRGAPSERNVDTSNISLLTERNHLRGRRAINMLLLRSKDPVS